jgi:hypothetical protein
LKKEDTKREEQFVDFILKTIEIDFDLRNGMKERVSVGA